MIALLTSAWTFLKSPVGKYLLIGAATLALVFGFATWQRHVQAAKDAPWITDPATHRKWKDEATDAQRDLKTCQANGATLTASLDAQNAAVEAQRADSERRAKMLADSLQAARAGRASAEARAAGLLKKPPAGADACARMEGADRAVLGALK